jgi:hypothetical protein
MEFGIGTRRRPIGQDYAAAKDAECGMKKKGRGKQWNSASGLSEL